MKQEMTEEDCHPPQRIEEPRIHGLIQAMLLLNIGEKPRYGYELIKMLSAELPEVLIPDMTVIYRMLRKMEKDAYVKSQLTSSKAGPARKVYILTQNGIEYLAQWNETIHIRVKALYIFLNKYEKISSHIKIEEVLE